METIEKPLCFVVAPIGADGSSTRTRSDQILRYIIEPVADQCGFRAKRADQISEPGVISTQIIDHILNDPMVVADLTEHNPNVFYELAVRQAIRKPYVQIIQKGERIPFDVAGLRTIEVDHKDLDSVAKAKDEIRRQMEFTRDNPSKVESPITMTVDREALRASGDPEKRQTAEILAALGEIKALIESRTPPVTYTYRYGSRSWTPSIAVSADEPFNIYTAGDLLKGEQEGRILVVPVDLSKKESGQQKPESEKEETKPDSARRGNK